MIMISDMMDSLVISLSYYKELELMEKAYDRTSFLVYV